VEHRWLARLGFGLAAGLGCGLLTPYPGNENPADVLASSTGGEGGSPFNDGDPQEPLIDPAEDGSMEVDSNVQKIVANEGEAFTVDLHYTAERMNVVGGGIQFEDKPEVQWTLLEEYRGTFSGDIRFGYVVEQGTCERIGYICREVMTRQFAVGENPENLDVDGDGAADGDFVVSPAVEVPVILRCATCESPSCQELLMDTPETCSSCNQPPLCGELYELCFAEGRPLYMTDEADDFERFFGPEGVAWKTPGVCKAGEMLCQSAYDSLAQDCMDADTDTDGITGTT
jgi:hypothetical protein